MRADTFESDLLQLQVTRSRSFKFSENQFFGPEPKIEKII